MMDVVSLIEQNGIRLHSHTERSQKTTCPACSATRKKQGEQCLSVNIVDGWWKCHHCGWSGNVQSRVPLKEWKPFPNYERWLNRRVIETDAELVEAYFIKRGISPFTLQANGVAAQRWMIEREKDVLVATFPYTFNDVVVNVKARAIEKKSFGQTPGGQAIFYRFNSIMGKDTCVIVEGEIDALSLFEAGIDYGISVPGGASNEKEDPATSKRLRFLDDCMPFMRLLKKIVIFVDEDSNGIRLRDELVRRFGYDRCYFVQRPNDCKDANDVLVKHGRDALRDMVNGAQIAPISGYTKPMDYFAGVQRLFQYGYPKMAKIGLPSFDKHLQFTSGGVTLVTGHPNNGKSTFMNYVIISLASSYNWRFLIYTPENYPPEYHISEIAEQLIGKQLVAGSSKQMSQDEMEYAMNTIQEFISYLEPEGHGAYSVEEITTKASWAVKNYGINALVIDPWNKVRTERHRAETETEYICRVLTHIVAFARREKVHVFLIAHPTKASAAKPSDFDKTPGRHELIKPPVLNDVSGSKDFVAMVDNGFVVHKYYDEVAQMSMAEISIEKVRYKFTGRTGKVVFRFEQKTSSFFETEVDSSYAMPMGKEEPY
jgi:twinkle protein